MGISRRHHYIPEFLIRQFADTDGLIHVYDKTAGRFWTEKKPPKSIFFEWNRNNIEVKGVLGDHLEQMYAKIDDRTADILVDLLETKELTTEVVTELLVFAWMLKWRLPASDSEFAQLEKELGQEQLHIRFRLKVAGDEADQAAAMDYLLQSKMFKESKRVMIPFLPFYKDDMLTEETVKEIVGKCFLHSNETVTSILGDVPIIEQDPTSIHRFSYMVFPLSAHDVFIYADLPQPKVSKSIFYMQKDLNIFHQAIRYVACKDKSHLERIIVLYMELERAGGIHNMTKYMFQSI